MALLSLASSCDRENGIAPLFFHIDLAVSEAYRLYVYFLAFSVPGIHDLVGIHFIHFVEPHWTPPQSEFECH